MTIGPFGVPLDDPPPGTYDAMFAALLGATIEQIGPPDTRLLVLPIRDDGGVVRGGFWGHTAFRWLHVQLLVVPGELRHRGIGRALMVRAEREAAERGCRGAVVDALVQAAAGFYAKLGYREVGAVDDLPPGGRRVWFAKALPGPLRPGPIGPA